MQGSIHLYPGRRRHSRDRAVWQVPLRDGLSHGHEHALVLKRGQRPRRRQNIYAIAVTPPTRYAIDATLPNLDTQLEVKINLFILMN